MANNEGSGASLGRKVKKKGVFFGVNWFFGVFGFRFKLGGGTNQTPNNSLVRMGSNG